MSKGDKCFIGQEVTIREDIRTFHETDRVAALIIHENMKLLGGRRATITDAQWDAGLDEYIYTLDVDGGEYSWSSNHFEEEHKLSEDEVNLWHSQV